MSGTAAWAGSVSQPLGQSSFGSLAVDDGHQHVFVSSPSGNAVLVYDFKGDLVTTIPDIYGAWGMVVHGSTLYVAESTAGAIEAIDLATLTDQGSLATGLVDPQWLVFAGDRLWTTVDPSYSYGKLASVDLTGNVSVFSDSYYSPDLAASPGDPNALYVAEDGLSPGAIYKLDVASGSPTQVEHNPATNQENIEGLAVSPDGSRVIPASGWPYEFEELSSSTLTADGITYPGEAYPAAVAVSPGDGGLVATGLSGDNTPDISVFPLGRPAAIFTASTGATNGNWNIVPHGLALSADGTRLFAITSDNVYDTAFHLWTFGLDPTSSTTTVEAAADPTIYGHQVTLTATVAPSDGGGSVAFQDNGSTIAGCADVVLAGTAGNETATCETNSLAVGSDTITATYSGDPGYDGSSGSAKIAVNSSIATTVRVSLSPSSLVADGSSTTTATVTVSDAHGQPVLGDTVNLTADPSSAATIGPLTDNGNGSYTATITSSTTPGRVIISAADASVSPAVGAYAFLAEMTDPAATVNVALNPATIYADGSSTTTATATVLNAEGLPLSGQSVRFSANPAGAVTIGPVTDHGDGTYTATITSSSTAGDVTITATDGSTTPAAAGNTVLRETDCPAVTVTVRLDKTEIVADGHSSTTAIATVLDAQGDPLTGQTVVFSADPAEAVRIGPVADHGGGSYTATVTSSRVTGQVIITATDTSAAPTGCAVLSVGSPSPTPDAESVLRSVPRAAGQPTANHPRQDTGPSPNQIRFSLAQLLAPHGHTASIGAILSHGFYSFSYASPGRGRLTVRWYHRSHGKSTLVASTAAKVRTSGHLVVKLRLTRVGRATFEHVHRLRLTARVSFTPIGRSPIRRGDRFTLR